jgi:mono/diheme cytochrome c family protein
MKEFSVILIRKLINIGILLCLAVIAVAFLGCSQERGPSFPQGKKIYETYCLACHGTNGEGVIYSKSALNHNDFVTGDSQEVLKVILSGKEGPALMPGWGKQLNNQEIAAVATYIRQAWSNRADPVTPAMVQAIRKHQK